MQAKIIFSILDDGKSVPVRIVLRNFSTGEVSTKAIRVMEFDSKTDAKKYLDHLLAGLEQYIDHWPDHGRDFPLKTLSIGKPDVL